MKKKKKKAILNDTEVALSGTVGTSPSYIFICNISQGTTEPYRDPVAGIRIYDFEISKNDVLVKSFVPCYCKVAVTDVNGNSCEPNTIGMYELVNGKFYTNAGGGTFLKGQEQGESKMTYMIIKQENRPDGITNRTTENRQSFASAMSLYYSWASTASATELFTSVALTVIDNMGNIIKNELIPTAYVAE